jgi:hypothetical protein
LASLGLGLLKKEHSSEEVKDQEKGKGHSSVVMTDRVMEARWDGESFSEQRVGHTWEVGES